jgi:hypothetical protein
MQMTIKNPNLLPTVDYRGVRQLQSDLKDLSDKNYQKLKRVLKKRGFDVPLFLWQDKLTEHFYLLDGHQRQRVMSKEDANDKGSYEVPYIIIDAQDVTEAKERLLEITSQYGKMTYEGYEVFTAELNQVELEQTVVFDALPLLDQRSEAEDEAGDELEEGNTFKITVRFDDQSEYENMLVEVEDLAKRYNCSVSVNSA